MTMLRRLLPLILAFALAAPVAAEPLALSDLLRLSSEGVGEAVLLSIARNQGVAPSLTADQVLAMSRQGWSDELMAAVVEAAAKQPQFPPASPVAESDPSVIYEERDGAVVARLRGEAEDAAPMRAAEIPPPAAVPAPQIIVVQAPAGPAAAPAVDGGSTAGFTDAYPVGAFHGWSGSTVFLPSHFGGSTPSAFGRAIVSTGGGPGYYRTPYAAPLSAYGFGHGGAIVTEAPVGQTTVIRTSRGTRRIPN